MDTYLNIWSFSEAAEVLGGNTTLPLMVSTCENMAQLFYLCRNIFFLERTEGSVRLLLTKTLRLLPIRVEDIRITALTWPAGYFCL